MMSVPAIPRRRRCFVTQFSERGVICHGPAVTATTTSMFYDEIFRPRRILCHCPATNTTTSMFCDGIFRTRRILFNPHSLLFSEKRDRNFDNAKTVFTVLFDSVGNSTILYYIYITVTSQYTHQKNNITSFLFKEGDGKGI